MGLIGSLLEYIPISTAISGILEFISVSAVSGIISSVNKRYLLNEKKIVY